MERHRTCILWHSFSLGPYIAAFYQINTREVMDVSIIMPVYQVSPYIGDCLKSVMHQTYTGSMECLIVDDSCTDDSIAIAERMIDGYEGPIKFRILHHEENRGLSAARNTGTLQATGEYLYYIDSDDEMTEDCIKKLMAVASQDPSIEMVQGNTCRHTLQKESVILVKDIALPLPETNSEVRKCYYRYRQIYANVWNKLFRRDYIINNHLLCREGIIHEDELWMFYLVKHLTKACFLPDITYHQKKRQGSITTGTDIRTRIKNYSIVYWDVLTHLTLGHEQEELNYYSNRIVDHYWGCVRKVSTFEEVIQLCREKSRQYGSRKLRLKLTAIYYLGKFRYAWVVMALLKRMRHPGLVRRDIHRLRWRLLTTT